MKPVQSFFRLWPRAFALVLSFAFLLPDPAAAANKTVSGLFNSKEVQSSNLKPFKKWTSALKRYSKETADKKEGTCKSKDLNKCHFQKWESFLKGLRGKDRMTQVKEVNRVMNKAKYITDKNNWGKKDYWATPGEFMARFGDCEDYAISKYMSLRRLGFNMDQLRVVAVKDLNLKVGHAILVVYLDNKVYVLDNQIKRVVEAKSIRHYQPVFSINDKHWWRHRV